MSYSAQVKRNSVVEGEKRCQRGKFLLFLIYDFGFVHFAAER